MTKDSEPNGSKHALQDNEWYRQGIHGPVSRWCKAVEVDGDFMEKSGLETNLLTLICAILKIF
jgi:hypothetical protein